MATVVSSLTVILVVCCVQLSHQTQCFCVVPSPIIEQSCSDDDCMTGTLEFFAANSSLALNYSTFYFLPGNHSLQQVFNATGSFGSVTNITIIGLTNSTDFNSSNCSAAISPAANIWCRNNAGFYFENVNNFSIVSLGFLKCGFRSSYSFKAAIMIRYASNLFVCGVKINYPNGWGLHFKAVYGLSIVTNTSISHGHSGEGYIGGNLHIIYNGSVNKNSSLTIQNSVVADGVIRDHDNNLTYYGGGAHVYIRSNDTISICFEMVRFIGNEAGAGGNVAVTTRAINPYACAITVIFSNCYIEDGMARFGGGLYVSMSQEFVVESNTTYLTGPLLKVVQSKIKSNCAYLVGAGVYIQLHEHASTKTVSRILFESTIFDNNSNLATSHSKGGTAVNLINFHVPVYLPHQLIQFEVSFVSCNFTNNKRLAPASETVGSGVLYVEENARLTLMNCTFENNTNSGITAVHSNIRMEGDIILRNNTGFNGGGIVMCANSIIFLNLSAEVNILVENCHADNLGGGIYVEFECSQAFPPCFFQVNSVTEYPKTIFNLKNNTARKAGTAIYGGAVDSCFQYAGTNHTINKWDFFDHLFNITASERNKLSSISSDPVKVCFCDESGTIPQCDNITHHYGSIYPGSTLSLYVVTVGQRHGTVPGIVVASPKSIIGRDNTHQTHQTCTKINYTIKSSHLNQETCFYLFISKTGHDITDEGNHNIIACVKVEYCPLGFALYQTHCACACWFEQLPNDHSEPNCNITTVFIHRYANSTWWIGAKILNDSRIPFFGYYCPFDYCVRKHVNIYVKEQGFEDTQCAHDRTGVLCGSCEENLSNVLGSNSCLNCHSHFSSLRLCGLVLLFALLGIVLVFLIGILDLTVSEGSLNAIVFYMNVVKVNTSVFFDATKTSNKITNLLKVFVFWMNLDFGIETCFFNGMESIGKTALQFVFPLYLFFLSGLIIFFSRKSSLITKLFGKNVVKILATVIFHSYAKILRSVINIFRVSQIAGESFNSTCISTGNVTYVWTIDGAVSYLSRTHLILFIVAIIVTAITLPYTLALIFIQCLKRRSNMKVLFWVNKLKPFFDAYTGPYMDNYHFWTGFLLFVRIVLFISIAVNTTKGEILNLTLISSTAAILLVLIQPGIYKQRGLNIIEAITYANLGILSACTTYDLRLNYSNYIVIIVCIGSIFLQFCAIIMYHILKKVMATRRWGLLKLWLLNSRWPWMKRKQIRSLILRNYTDGNEDTSSSDSELDPILQNAPPVARYDQLREPLIDTS